MLLDVRDYLLLALISLLITGPSASGQRTFFENNGVKDCSSSCSSIINNFSKAVLRSQLNRFGELDKLLNDQEKGRDVSAVQHPPTSCLEILRAKRNSAPSGEYTLWVPRLSTNTTVFCEMGLNGGGYTFLDPFDLPKLVDDDVQAMFTERTSFLFRAKTTDGSQPYAVLQQLQQYSMMKLQVYLNNYAGYKKAMNIDAVGPPYLYYGFLPVSVAAVRGVTQGFQANGVAVTFVNGDANPNSYMALFANFNEVRPSTYHSNIQWPMTSTFIQSLQPVHSRRVMPEKYFMFLEIHQGGGGTYTQTDGRLGLTGILSASIGFR